MPAGLNQCVMRLPELGIPEDDWKRCDGAPEGTDSIMCPEHWSMVPREVRMHLWSLQGKAKKLRAHSYGKEWGELAQEAIRVVLRTLLKAKQQEKREADTAKEDLRSCDVANYFAPCSCGSRWTLRSHAAYFECHGCGGTLIFGSIMRDFNAFLVSLVPRDEGMTVGQINTLAEMIYNPGGRNV